MSRVVVVGAGLGGLAAAARLAAGGHEVTVLEQASRAGGKLGTFERDGHRFDTGPSLLTMPHLLDELFADTGAPLGAEVALRRLDVACRYTFGDGTVLDLPGDLADVPGALDTALGAGAGADWSALLQRAARMWDVTREPFLESAVTPGGLLRLSRRLEDVRTVAPWASLRGLGGRYLHDPRLRQLLDRYATYTGSDPRRAPAALLTVPWVEQAYGSWYVDGGLRVLVDALVTRLEDVGAELRTDSPVLRIRSTGRRVTGVDLADGEHLPADVVVANVDAHTVHGHLLDDAPRMDLARTRRAERSLAGFVLLLALDDVGDPPAHHQVLFTDDYDAEFDAVFGRGGAPRPVRSPTVYVSAPDDPALAPPGGASWFVLVNAPRHDPAHGVDWDRPGLADAYADRVVAVMAERGLDVRGRVRWRHVLTPADLERDTRTPGGAIYGTASNGPAAAFLRPPNATRTRGLFLVGGSSHPGGGLPLVLLSARIVAGLVGQA